MDLEIRVKQLEIDFDRVTTLVERLLAVVQKNQEDVGRLTGIVETLVEKIEKASAKA